MIDTGTAAIVAAGAAVVVGFGGAILNRRTALDTQRASDQARALLRLIQVVELNGRGLQDAIFNLTEARSDNNPYGPRPRQGRELAPEELAEAGALLAAYGSRELDKRFARWIDAVQAIEDAYLTSEANYMEHRLGPFRSDLTTVVDEELAARRELGAKVRTTLRGER